MMRRSRSRPAIRSQVVIRPAEISGDAAGSESALLHVLDHLEAAEATGPSWWSSSRRPLPLRRPGSVQAAIDTARSERRFALLGLPASRVRLAGHGAGSSRSPTTTATAHAARTSAGTRREWLDLRRQDAGSSRARQPPGAARSPVYPNDPLQFSFQIDEPGDFELLERGWRDGLDPPAAPSLGGIRLLVLDFDGVMTDNRVLVAQDGAESVMCHRGDGWGIARLKERGVEVAVISTEANRVVEARCRKLGLGSSRHAMTSCRS